MGLGVYKFISLEENCVFPRPLWERAGERGQAGLGEKKFRSLDEVFLYSSLFNPQAPLPEIRDFDPPTRGGLSLITWSLDHPVTSPKDCRGAATLRNASNKRTLHSSRLTLHSSNKCTLHSSRLTLHPLLEKLKRSYKFLITWSLDHLVTSRNKEACRG